MAITAPVGFVGREGPSLLYERTAGKPSRGADDPILGLVRRIVPQEGCLNAFQLIQGGVFDRFPKLKVYWAETLIGWLPYFLEQLDDSWNRGQYWMGRYYGLKPLARRPSEYIQDHCLWGFVHDPYGVRARDEIGIHRVMWGSDFPHARGNWPHSRQVIEKMFAGVPEEERYQMLAGNAVEFFHLENAG